MNTLSPRQYLVQISLKTITCQPSSQISKAFCQLHYGQSYIKFKTHPQIAPNGIANFKKQTICIPYSDDIALVFKKNISSKKELFLGHYQVQIQEYLQRKIYYIEITDKLYETETQVNFQCRIIDKQRFAESQTQDLSQEQSVMLKSRYSESDQDPTQNMRTLSIRQSYSEYNSGRRSPRSSQSPQQQRPSQKFNRQQFSPLLQEEFGKKIYYVDEILKKKNMFNSQQETLGSFQRNHRGQLKSQKIEKLEKLMKNKKEEFLFNTFMIYVAIALASLFIGVVIAT